MATRKAPAGNDAYTAMMMVSVLGMMIGSGLLFVDYSRYSVKKPAEVSAPVKLQAGPLATTNSANYGLQNKQ